MSRGRTLALALGVLFGLIAFVVVTVWILLSVMEDGALPGETGSRWSSSRA